jgi:hypothetical protein
MINLKTAKQIGLTIPPNVFGQSKPNNPVESEEGGEGESKIGNRKSKMYGIPPNVLARADRVIK